MTSAELIELVRLGESSAVQFKERAPHPDSLAQEMIAFSNSKGGIILFGVNDKTGALNGLSFVEIQQLNQQIVNAASTKVYPPVFLTTETVLADDQAIVVVSVPEGAYKPYKDSSGIIYLKNGADKRKVTSNEELARLLSSGGMISPDEQPIHNTAINDLDLDYFTFYFNKNNKVPLDEQSISFESLLQNMKIMSGDKLTLSGALLFGREMQFRIPLATVKAVAFFGNSIADTQYIDSREITGKLIDIYRESISFFSNNLRLIQIGDNFNTPGVMEVPLTVFQEIVVNALIHRDFFVSANIRLMIFKNRIEITSPGHLPNTLTTESIKYGISTKRNPLLASFASRILPYNGLGTGITRALEAYPHITFEDDRVCNQFRVTIMRPEIEKLFS